MMCQPQRAIPQFRPIGKMQRIRNANPRHLFPPILLRHHLVKHTIRIRNPRELNR